MTKLREIIHNPIVWDSVKTVLIAVTLLVVIYQEAKIVDLGGRVDQSVQELKSFTDPKSCLVIFSRLSNSVSRWDLKRDTARIHGLPPPPRPEVVETSNEAHEGDVVAPEMQAGGRCRDTFLRLEPILPK